MGRKKTTARKDTSGKAPRKQLASLAQRKKSKTTTILNETQSEIPFENSEPPASPPASPSLTKSAKKRQKQQAKKQKKQLNKEQQKRQKIQQRRDQEKDYAEVYAAYVDGTSDLGDLGEGFEFEVPPTLLKINRELEGPEVNHANKRGPKKTKKCVELDDCGVCQKSFRDLTKYRNHMPFHYRDNEGGGCSYCMFCKLAGRKTIECVFATDASLVQHLLTFHFIAAGALALGKEFEKPELLPKPQNTQDWQRKLAKVLRLSYKLPKDIKFQEIQNKQRGSKSDNPEGYTHLTTSPENAKTWEELTTLTVHWNKGGPVEYTKENPILKCFVESSGCFQVEKLLVGRGGSYDHECLRTLVEPASYAAPTHFEVDKVVNHRGTGSQKEYLVKWSNYRIETWISVKETKDCKEVVQDYEQLNYDDYEEDSREESE